MSKMDVFPLLSCCAPVPLITESEEPVTPEVGEAIDLEAGTAFLPPDGLQDEER